MKHTGHKMEKFNKKYKFVLTFGDLGYTKLFIIILKICNCMLPV